MLPFVKKGTHRDNGTKLMFVTAEAGVSDTLILLTIISLFLGSQLSYERDYIELSVSGTIR